MKKKLESDLINIAHRILKLEGKEDVIKMHAEVQALYEILSVLKFGHENFEGDLSKIGGESSFFSMLGTAFNNKVSDNIEVEDRIYVNLDEVTEDNITETNMVKIKNMLKHMPSDDEGRSPVFQEPIKEKEKKVHHLDDLTSGFEKMPEFEPADQESRKGNEKKSLNDKINKGRFNIGLNDKIAFIKHLFNGSQTDYDRVISQLNTSANRDEAMTFIEDMVKPDYNNWDGQEELEARFIEIIESKFE
ncbi:hypothetical protein V8G61_14245 [Gaetbulibacter sp. M240]|uniref:hypothetical protein n=1 Tax=Gaetbulibacter sp. M240 TaxID=3126511 RepID=UPI00374F6BB9